MRGLKDKVALVSGGGGAIGGAVARRLAEEGAVVCVADHISTKAQTVAQEIVAAGGRARSFALDITDRSQVLKTVAEIEAGVGPVDIVVNSVGWDKFANFIDTDPEDWDNLIAINLKGPMLICHAVLPGMAQRLRGRVVNISSDVARIGVAGEAVYGGAKGGVVSFTKSVAREMAHTGVTLNVVCPGPTDTPLLRDFIKNAKNSSMTHEALAAIVPMKRLGVAEDFPGIVSFLVSEDAAFITGQVVSVSGGLTMAG